MMRLKKDTEDTIKISTGSYERRRWGTHRFVLPPKIFDTHVDLMQSDWLFVGAVRMCVLRPDNF
jgi:hypothetical protein